MVFEKKTEAPTSSEDKFILFIGKHFDFQTSNLQLCQTKSLSEKYSFIEKRNPIDSTDSVCIAESVLTFTVKREKETESLVTKKAADKAVKRPSKPQRKKKLGVVTMT